MLIFRPYETRLLQPVPQSEWREPSLAQPKDQFGNQNRTWFRLSARLNDGALRWRGWFDSREDADAFLWAIATGRLVHEPALWRLPTPAWHPDLGRDLAYELATTSLLTTTSASNQTYNVPSDYRAAGSAIDVIASGGSGAVRRNLNSGSGTVAATGGSGGGWSQKVNLSLTPGGTATYRLSVGGATVSGAALGTSTDGNNGADAWFNGTTLAGSSVGAKGGLGGKAAAATTAAGVAGGASASGIGSSKNSGGASGSTTTGRNTASSGGGGAGGSGGAGVTSGDVTGGGVRFTDGGDGGAPSGGTGSAGLANSSPTAAGGTGTAYDSTHGSGGGSGGIVADESSSIRTSGDGGYGAGSGGACGRNTTGNVGAITSGDGGQALIFISYVTGGLYLGVPLMA